jgi:hypothetical protein
MTTTPTANAKTNEVTIFERLLSNGLGAGGIRSA